MTKEEIKELLVNNSREWIKEIQQDVAVIYVDDFIDELLSKLHQPTVISAVCEHNNIGSEYSGGAFLKTCLDCGRIV